jgi:hypothetical protein
MKNHRLVLLSGNLSHITFATSTMENIRMCYTTRLGTYLFRWRLTNADTTRIMSANLRPPIAIKKI